MNQFLCVVSVILSLNSCNMGVKEQAIEKKYSVSKADSTVVILDHENEDVIQIVFDRNTGEMSSFVYYENYVKPIGLTVTYLPQEDSIVEFGKFINGEFKRIPR